MNRWKLYLGLLLLFISGVAIGALGSGFYARAKIRQIVQGGPPAARAAQLQVASRVLRLSGEQQRAVGDILERRQSEALRIRWKIQPQVNQLLDETEQEIRGELSEQQLARFDKIVSHIREVRSTWLEAMEQAERDAGD